MRMISTKRLVPHGKWKKHETHLKKYDSSHTKMLCLDCHKQVRLNKNKNCCECSGPRMLEAGKAYRVPRKGDKGEWKYLEKLFALYPVRKEGESIPYIGFHPNRINYNRFSNSIAVTKAPWVVTEYGGFRDFKQSYVVTNYDAKPDLNIKNKEEIAKDQMFARNKEQANKLKL
jgi:hypothetical protein